MHDALLRRRAVEHVTDVTDEDGRAADRLDRQIVQLFDGLGRVVQLHGILQRTDLGRAGRQDLILRSDRRLDVLRGQALGLEGPGIQVDLDLADPPAIGIGDGRPRDGAEQGAHDVHRLVQHLLLRLGRARGRQLQDRNGGGVVVQDQRRGRARRKLLQHRLGDGGHLSRGGADVDARLEVDLDDAHPRQRLALDVLDVVDRQRQGTLIGRDDPAGHFVRGKPVVAPSHADHRHADVGEDVGRRPQRRQRTDDQDEQRQNDKGVGPLQRYPDDPQHLGPSSREAVTSATR